MYQEITIVGNIGREPDYKTTQQGKAVCQFSVATTRNTMEAGVKGKETTWFKVSVWDRAADYIKNYAHKGNKILVRGRLACDPQTGGPRIFFKPDGNAICAFEVVADTVRLLTYDGDGNQSQQQSQPQQQAQPRQQQPWQTTAFSNMDDDIPF